MLPLLAAFLLAAASASAQHAAWQWVVGKLPDPAANRTYRAFAKRTFDYYQQRKALPGELVEEAEFDATKRDRVVFLGPLKAFAHPERFGLPLSIRGDGSIGIGTVVLGPRDRAGLFLRNAAQTRFLYTGMTPRGFRDLFTVPTGRQACTITKARGKIALEGNYRGGVLRLAAAAGAPLVEMPGVEQLRRVRLPKGAVTVAPVYSRPDSASGDDKRGAALTPGFKKRLAQLTENNNVLFVGESHWNVGVNRLFNAILSELLATRDVRAVFLEVNYSFSAFFDHYVTLDDTAAAAFLRNTLHPLVNMRSVLATLDLVRRHNLAGAKPRVHIACLDLEWNPGVVLRHLERAARTAKEYPYITKEFRANARQNLRDTRELRDFKVQRQRAIIRNITKFHGDLLGAGLAVFKGGGFHAIKHPVAGEKIDRDAEYLHNTYPKTKGRVGTLWIHGLGYGFREVARLDPRDRLTSATNYHELVARFRAQLAKGAASVDRYYLFDGRLDPVATAIARSASELDTDVVWVESFDRAKAGRGHRLADYDATAVVVRAQLERTRPKSLRPK